MVAHAARFAAYLRCSTRNALLIAKLPAESDVLLAAAKPYRIDTEKTLKAVEQEFAAKQQQQQKKKKKNKVRHDNSAA